MAEQMLTATFPAPQPRPYSEHHLRPLTDTQWMERPATWLPIHTLTPSQSGLSLEHLARLACGDTSLSGDPAGRVVSYNGRLWLHDGHHRWTIALLRGENLFLARVVDIHGNPVPDNDHA